MQSAARVGIVAGHTAMTNAACMGIGSDPAALRELLSSLDRALEAHEKTTTSGACVDDVLDARVRVREIQSRRELVLRRLAILTQGEDPS